MMDSIVERTAKLVAHTTLAAKHYKMDEYITEELPRNPTGKVLKKELRKPHWEGRGRATV